MNKPRNKNFNQVCVWPGTIVPEQDIENFVEHFSQQGFRIQYLETIMTGPDKDDQGSSVSGTGGRSDIFFSIHDEDILRFAVPRLHMGIRWIEDVLNNEAEGQSLYPERVAKYRTW